MRAARREVQASSHPADDARAIKAKAKEASAEGVNRSAACVFAVAMPRQALSDWPLHTTQQERAKAGC